MRRQDEIVPQNLLGPIGSYSGIAGFVPRRRRKRYMALLHACMREAHFDGAGVTLPPDKLRQLIRLARRP
jgi:hypothetical protein